MKLAENPKKITNIVVPNIKKFQELYHPLLQKHFPSIDLTQPILSQDLGENTTRNILDQLPATLKSEVSKLAATDNSKMPRE
jgi:hypothetical protein